MKWIANTWNWIIEHFEKKNRSTFQPFVFFLIIAIKNFSTLPLKKRFETTQSIIQIRRKKRKTGMYSFFLLFSNGYTALRFCLWKCFYRVFSKKHSNLEFWRWVSIWHWRTWHFCLNVSSEGYFLRLAWENNKFQLPTNLLPYLL